MSYKCTAACRHCMYACNPGWDADWISGPDLERTLSQLAAYIRPSPMGPNHIGLSHGLHLSGGEPFMNYDLLCRATEIATGLSIPSLFVETNCFWCRDDRSTREKLLVLRDKGMKGIMISVNPFYLEYVPFERTERAVRIGYEIFGENTFVYQAEYFRRFKALGIKEKVPLTSYLELENHREVARHTEFFIMGRAPYELKDELADLYPRYPAGILVQLPCSPPFLREWHNHFDNYCNYIPGFCGGITLGDCRELDKILEKGINLRDFPVLDYLVRGDMQGLLKFAKKSGYTESDEGYYSKCHLCVDIRKHLHQNQELKELKPAGFYANLS